MHPPELVTPENREVFILFGAKTLILEFLFRENYLEQLFWGKQNFLPQRQRGTSRSLSLSAIYVVLLAGHHDVPLALCAGGGGLE